MGSNTSRGTTSSQHEGHAADESSTTSHHTTASTLVQNNGFHKLIGESTQFNNDHISLDFEMCTPLDNSLYFLNMRGSTNLRSNTHLSLKDERGTLLRLRLVGSSFVLAQQFECPTKYFTSQMEKGIFDVEVKSPQPFVFSQNLKLVVSKIAKKTARHISKYITFLIEIENVGYFTLSFGHKKCMKTSVVFATSVFVSQSITDLTTTGTDHVVDHQESREKAYSEKLSDSSPIPSPALSSRSKSTSNTSSPVPLSSFPYPPVIVPRQQLIFDSPVTVYNPNPPIRKTCFASPPTPTTDSKYFTLTKSLSNNNNNTSPHTINSTSYSTSNITNKPNRRMNVQDQINHACSQLQSGFSSTSTAPPFQAHPQPNTLFECNIYSCEFQACATCTIVNHSAEEFDEHDRISVTFAGQESQVLINQGLVTFTGRNIVSFRLPAIPLDYCHLQQIKAKMFLRINERVIFVDYFTFRNGEYDFAFQPLERLFGGQAASNSQALSFIFN